MSATRPESTTRSETIDDEQDCEDDNYEEEEDDFDPDEPLPSDVSREMKLQWQAARRGTRHAEDMTNPVWTWLIRTRLNAYLARKQLGVSNGPGWCFDRMGQTATELADGRKILVAGEHEDHYDPDFYIYNDVIVKWPDGSVRIFGYPESVFPPTDFHTATLLDDQSILLVGSLGYPHQRQSTTQVFRLDTDTMKITRIVSGGESPGWLHGHKARLGDDGTIIVSHGKVDSGASLIENIDEWAFDLTTSQWSRLTNRQWPLAEISRVDKQRHHHWEFEQAIFERQYHVSEIDYEGQLRDELGIEPNLELFPTLLVPPIRHTRLPDEENEYGVVRLTVDGVVIRYVIEMYSIEVTFEGSLSPTILNQVTEDLRNKLTKMESAECEINWLRSPPAD